MEKIWEIKDPDAYTRGKKTVIRRGPPPREEKDPAKAYSLSMFYWGGGQLYIDHIVKGTAFLLTAVTLLAFVILGVIYCGEVLDFLRSRNISLSSAFLGGEIFLFLVLLFWAFNAGDAYQGAARTRKVRFRGVNSRISPFLGSLVCPGWGQFLNGQPLKGSVYSGLTVIGTFAVFSTVLTYLVWPLLDATDTRYIVEGISSVSICIVPFVPLLWAVSVYDALKVSLDDLLKEPLWERIKAAYYRGRTQGWMRGVFPQVKRTFMLVLFLSFFLIVVHYWFPESYYIDLLTGVKRVLSDRGMTIVPEMIERALALMVSRQ
jgi:TM2 domain-containing membrane protein YozV